MSSKLSIIGEKPSCSSGPTLNPVADTRPIEAPFVGRAALITLGCAKNQVDSEVMLGVLKSRGYEIVTELSEADVAIVNTCSFLQSSTQESVDAILEVSEFKKSGKLRKLIVAGCLVSRYKEDLKKTLPEVDSFISIDDVLSVGDAAESGFSRILDDGARPYFLYDETMPRHLSTRQHMAYVKVSEGCDRPCAFCIIPKIRGGFRSRTVDSVVAEVKDLGSRGVREVNLVAQDLTAFGSDRRGPGLLDLITALNASAAVDWVRLLYSYPIGITPELLRGINSLPRVCSYLDLPLQHSSEAVLKAMKRPVGQYSARKIVELIKQEAPHVALRTTFIVGFPGETEDDVQDLHDFIADGHFSSVGIFTYSQEEGTPAGEMEGQIPEDVKTARRDKLMAAQQLVVEAKLSSMVGCTLKVLVEGLHEDTDLLLTGRAEFQAPEVDGLVIINDLDLPGLGIQGEEFDASSLIGQMVNVEVTEFAGYDLIGRVVSMA